MQGGRSRPIVRRCKLSQSHVCHIIFNAVVASLASSQVSLVTRYINSQHPIDNAWNADATKAKLLEECIYFRCHLDPIMLTYWQHWTPRANAFADIKHNTSCLRSALHASIMGIQVSSERQKFDITRTTACRRMSTSRGPEGKAA